jgi:hypothetical protein
MSVRVLVGFADALAAIESVWSLSEDGFEVHAFARRGARCALAHSPAVQIAAITPPEKDALRSASEITTLARELDPAAVLPLDDHAVWLCDRAVGSAGPTVVAGPTGELASLALDKRLQLDLAGRAGFSVPAWGDGSRPLPGQGPWMVKPALAVELRGAGLWRGTGRVAMRPGDVEAIAADMGGPVIVQPLIAGVGEGVFGVAIAGVGTALSGHQRIRMMNPRGSGSSACRSIPVAPDVASEVQELIRKSGWHGLFMVELLRDNAGTAWFMELNGRAWGSMALARHRGYAYPNWAVQSALDPQFVPAEPPVPPNITARHLGREIVHLGTVLASGQAPRLATVLQVVSVRRGDRWYNYKRGEGRVFAADTWATVCGQVGPRIRRAVGRILRRQK